MCIRDRHEGAEFKQVHDPDEALRTFAALEAQQSARMHDLCLLYTSDAADERSSVDLGGRRIIKKKTINKHGVMCEQERKRRT